MDKAAMKKFAITARKKLLAAVTKRASTLGITKNKIVEPVQFRNGVKMNGQPFSKEERKQRAILLKRMEQTSFDEVIDEAAYTWFIRFIAIRYMEVNNYLLTENKFFSFIEQGKENIVIHIDSLMNHLSPNDEYVKELKKEKDNDTLFQYVLMKQCLALSDIMPAAFEQITKEIQILFPNQLLDENSIIFDLVTMIEKNNWHHVEIIGWLYQYYQAEKKDEVFKSLRKNIKITKHSLPAATQLFTPKWIVEYMVDNSLGRLWIESQKDTSLTDKLTYYLEPAKQPKEVVNELTRLKERNIHPKSITFLDPCVGTGHILVYAFDLLREIYISKGYRFEDIPRLILENNLYGFDIDKRTTRLACFALMMKGRQHDPHIFDTPINLNVLAMTESNGITDEEINIFAENHPKLKNELDILIQTFNDATLLGSIIKVPEINTAILSNRLNELKKQPQINSTFLSTVENLIQQTEWMKKKYDIVVTNPPYMGRKSMNDKLIQYVRQFYPHSSADLFAVFMETASHYAKRSGFIGMINQHSWMFLSSFELLRKKLLQHEQIDSMVHLGRRAFANIDGEVVQTTAFILRKQKIKNYVATYIRLVDTGQAEEKSRAFFNRDLYYYQTQNIFSVIPTSPIAYWASEQIRNIFTNSIRLGSIAEPRQGLATANNNRFLRRWYEVEFDKISFHCASRKDAEKSSCKWFPYNKGGSYRKWYGNLDYVINWENDGTEIRNFKDHHGKQRSVIRNPDYYFREGITWSFVSSSNFGARYTPEGFLFDVGGSSLFPKKEDINLYVSFLSSKLATLLLAYLNPTMNFQVGNIASLPIMQNIQAKKEEIHLLATENIRLAKADWDSFETAWDFKTHPFLKYKRGATKIEDAFQHWSDEAEGRFQTVKANEQHLNQLFIEMYGLQNELTSEVEDKDVTIHRADKGRDVKSFLSYLVGIIFGRYSLNEEGIVFAGGKFNFNRYTIYRPDEENIIPITNGGKSKTLIERIIELIKVIFGEQYLEENITFIADALTRRKNETARARIRRYFLKQFYKDHVQMYQKRPIYWLLDSGKHDGFKALLYVHRYDEKLLSRVRTQFLHPHIRKYVDELEQINKMEQLEVSKAKVGQVKKEKAKIEQQLLECQAYDDVITHIAKQNIKLCADDGVKVNYEKFQKISVPQSAGKKLIRMNVLAKL